MKYLNYNETFFNRFGIKSNIDDFIKSYGTYIVKNTEKDDFSTFEIDKIRRILKSLKKVSLNLNFKFKLKVIDNKKITIELFFQEVLSYYETINLFIYKDDDYFDVCIYFFKYKKNNLEKGYHSFDSKYYSTIQFDQLTSFEVFLKKLIKIINNI